jgi:hypothetical protein
MGHYASEVEEPRSHHDVYQEQQERYQILLPHVEHAFLEVVALVPPEEKASIVVVFDETARRARQAVSNNPKAEKHSIDDDVLRTAFWTLVTRGFLSFTSNLKITDSGRQKLASNNSL